MVLFIKFPGAPIKIGRTRLATGGPLQALVINNKVSNVCSGGDGVADSELVCSAVASALKLPRGPSSVLPSSTGVIGWRLPAKALAEDVVPRAIDNMQKESALSAAEAIMTTDRWPKIRSCTLDSGARIVGIAKVCFCILLCCRRPVMAWLQLILVGFSSCLVFRFSIIGSWYD